jgi:hypothetical protein
MLAKQTRKNCPDYGSLGPIPSLRGELDHMPRLMWVPTSRQDDAGLLFVAAVYVLSK